MNRLFKTTALALGAAAVASGSAEAAEIVVTSNITTSETWTANNTYNLHGQVFVEDGATLTIEAGTVIASDGVIPGEPGGGLVVARGGKIFALGTQTNPIIFTSKADVATWASDPGHPTGKDPLTGTWRESANEWGNLTIEGRAYVSEDAIPGNTAAPSASNFGQMEGLVLAPGDEKGRYGGGNDDDDSGTVKYVSIRYGGKIVTLNNELNGLSLGGIGRATDIHHVEIMNNVDDGIEIWGGTVNLKYLSIWNIGDDSLDIDQGYRGQIQNVLEVQGHSLDAAQGSGVGDNLNEIDGAEDSYWQPVTTTTIYNLTAIGQPVPGAGDHGTAWRDNARVQYRNSIFMDLGEKLVAFDNVDGDGGDGYGASGTLSWADTWTTDSSVTSTVNPFADPAAAYKAQQPGKLAEIKDSVFFRNLDAAAYTEATARGVFDAGNNNVLIAGSDDLDSPIVSLVRGTPVVKGGKTLLPVASLDPRPANEALTSVAAAPAAGHFTPEAYRGAFAPNETWLTEWTASDAFGFTNDGSPWRTLGDELEGFAAALPELLGAGPLADGSANSLALLNARPSSLAILFVSLTDTPVPFKGGTLHPVPILLQAALFTASTGEFTLPFVWPTGIPAGTPFYFQYAVQDTDAVKDVALSNALQGVAQ